MRIIRAKFAVHECINFELPPVIIITILIVIIGNFLFFTANIFNYNLTQRFDFLPKSS